jgi:hypothetical protein
VVDSCNPGNYNKPIIFLHYPSYIWDKKTGVKGLIYWKTDRMFSILSALRVCIYLSNHQVRIIILPFTILIGTLLFTLNNMTSLINNFCFILNYGQIIYCKIRAIIASHFLSSICLYLPLLLGPRAKKIEDGSMNEDKVKIMREKESNLEYRKSIFSLVAMRRF